MSYTSSPTRQMSWRRTPRRVSVLAEMALRKELLAARLLELRTNEGLSQEDAARKVEVTVRQWQRWEQGESVPYPRNLDVIASKFGITVAEFFDETPRAVLIDTVEDLAAVVEDLSRRLAALELERELEAVAQRKKPRARSSGAKKPHPPREAKG